MHFKGRQWSGFRWRVQRARGGGKLPWTRGPGMQEEYCILNKFEALNNGDQKKHVDKEKAPLPTKLY